MAMTFNADEIFEIAEQIERNGAKFYRKATENAALADVKDALLDLAAMEDEHEKTFADMRAKLTPAEKAGASFDPDGEAALYLQAMADGKVFDTRGDPSERLTGDETFRDVLTTAIGLEKDSIVFYLAMKGMVPQARGRGKMDDIIKEEMSHIRILSEKMVAA